MTALANHILCEKCGGGGFFGGDEIEEVFPCEYCNGIGSLTPEKAKQIKKCSYCDEIVKEVQHTPIVSDMGHGHKICEPCWNISRDDIKGTYGREIGVFNPIREEL
ncbi:hypothetical protein [Terribacillus sp. JSM ZJ617]|uniref:hypothetical protein n=1 Tax=Terribacillus sp. JSM ZJ617 TaxID=3342119 RepID=UPI0035A909E0